jgi:hypothetical protein
MAKKKIQREVEEKGLDPTVPHAILGEDGRLFMALPELSIPEVVVQTSFEPVVEQPVELPVVSAAEPVSPPQEETIASPVEATPPAAKPTKKVRKSQ